MVLNWAVSTSIRFLEVMGDDMWILCEKRTYSASIHSEIFEWGSETAQTLVNNDYMTAYSLDYVSGDV